MRGKEKGIRTLGGGGDGKDGEGGEGREKVVGAPGQSVGEAIAGPFAVEDIVVEGSEEGCCKNWT